MSKDFTLILASGVGNRLRPITDKVHKALVPINGVPNLCRTVKFANEAGVSHNYIVTLESEKENFDRAFSDFGNVTVFSLNDSFIKGKNNSVSLEHLIISSMILFNVDENSKIFIIDADTYFIRNIFKDDFTETQYITQYRENEWVLIPDSTSQRVCRVEKSSTGYAMSGVSVWKVKQLRQLFTDLQNRSSDDLFYDDVIIEDKELLTSMRYSEQEPFMLEYDSVSDLVTQGLMTPEEIAKLLSDDNKAVSLKSMTNSSFLINYNSEKVVCRIEGQGFEFLDRKQENLITAFASEHEITPKSEFINEIKFTKYLENSTMLTIEDIENKTDEYQKVFEVLSKLHRLEIPRDVKPIDLISEIREYEKTASKGDFRVCTEEETEFFIRQIERLCDIDASLIHRDLVPANILLLRDSKEVKLIDWEYSGVLSIYWDIGCFASEIELEFSIPREEVFEDFLNFYCYPTEEYRQLSFQLMNQWSCIVDFVWAKWAEAKTAMGEDYRDYAELRHLLAMNFYKWGLFNG